jgi:hypothetical protein
MKSSSSLAKPRLFLEWMNHLLQLNRVTCWRDKYVFTLSVLRKGERGVLMTAGTCPYFRANHSLVGQYIAECRALFVIRLSVSYLTKLYELCVLIMNHEVRSTGKRLSGWPEVNRANSVIGVWSWSRTGDFPNDPFHYFFFYGSTALYGPGPPRFVEVSWSYTFETHHSR